MSLILDILFSVIFLLLTYNLKHLFKFTVAEQKVIWLVFLFHTVVCFAATPILFYGGDAHHYWFFPKEISFEELWTLVVATPRPSQIMFLICYFPSNILGLSFLPGMLLFSLLGHWAFLFIMAAIKSFIPNLETLRDVKLLGIPVYPLIFLLPNMHFWAVGIGKDTLLFFAVSIIIYASFYIRKRWFGLLIGAAVGYFLRPHVLLFLAAGYGLSFIFSTRLNLYQKVAFALVGSVVFFPLLNNVLAFARIEQFSAEHLENFSSSKSAVLASAGSGIDFSGYPYPLKVLTFVFRPFFFDVNGIPAVIASLENLAQLMFFIFFVKTRSFKLILKSNIVVRACFFYFIIGALAFAPVMSNLGIIIREKNMLMPAFLIFMMAAIKYKMITIENDGRN